MGKPTNNPPPVKNWIIDIVKKELKKISPISSSWSICKVPRKLRSVNRDAYTPHLVSIGPIHHKDKKLSAMEDHKRRYLYSLFKLKQEAHEREMFKVLGDCYNTITDLDKRVRDYYEESIPYDKKDLAKILLHDAGFLLELFLRYHQLISGTPQNDPIFTTSWMILKLQRDLALLENQIPFFVLESLFEHIAPFATAGPLPPLKELALQFFKSKMSISERAFRAKCKENGNHLLHLLYNCYLPRKPKPVGSRSKGRLKIIHCATLLDQAGVQFQKNKADDLFDFQFRDGTFKIPQLRIKDSTDSLFRNLVAFEQSLPDSKHYITSYIILMDYLIDTTKDVDLLQQKGIIENHLGGGDDVSYMFNNIGKQIVLDDFYFTGLCSQVNEFAKSPWHRYKVALRRDYFKNPWSILSFMAAVTLIFLTFLQTLYSILSYHQKS